MATVLRSSLVPILQAVQSQLTNQLGFDTSQVRLIKQWPPYQTVADQYVWIWPKEFVRDEVISDGSGRRSTVVRRVLWVILDSRLATDDIGGNENWLDDPTLGAIAAEEAIEDALEDYFPTDSGGNSLVYEPLKLQASSGEDGEAFAKRQPPPVGWGRVILIYFFTYQLPLNQATE